MALFQYEALNEHVDDLKGDIEALNSKDAISKLRDKSLFPKKVKLFSGREISSPKNTKAIFKDYTFEEWSALPSKDKIAVMNKYWSMFPPEQGKLTRDTILCAFLEKYPQFKNVASVGFRWFGWYVWCIYVVVENPSTHVPSEFSECLINKGVLKKQISPSEWIVDWRDVGGNNSKFDTTFVPNDKTNNNLREKLFAILKTVLPKK